MKIKLTILLTLIISFKAISNDSTFFSKIPLSKETIFKTMLVAGISSSVLYINKWQPFDGNFTDADRVMSLNICMFAVSVIIEGYNDNFYVSTGFDLRNAFIGGSVNERAFDGLYRFYYKKKVTCGLLYEYFNAIDYNCAALQIGYNYKFLSIGALINSIYNQNTNVASLGQFVEISSNSWHNFSVSGLVKYDLRPELESKTGVLSSYFNLIYNL